MLILVKIISSMVQSTINCSKSRIMFYSTLKSGPNYLVTLSLSNSLNQVFIAMVAMRMSKGYDSDSLTEIKIRLQM